MTTEERIMKRDEGVYRELMAQYGKLVWTVCGGILKNIGTVQDIEECAADVFIELWKNPRKFNPQKGGISAYLTVLAKSRALNAYRRLKPKLFDVPFDEDTGATADIVAEEAIGRIQAGEIMGAVGGLKEPDREIFYRRHCFGQKPREISRAMNLPVREIRNRLYQSKQKLKAIIGGDYCEIQ